MKLKVRMQYTFTSDHISWCKTNCDLTCNMLDVPFRTITLLGSNKWSECERKMVVVLKKRNFRKLRMRKNKDDVFCEWEKRTIEFWMKICGYYHFCLCFSKVRVMNEWKKIRALECDSSTWSLTVFFKTFVSSRMSVWLSPSLTTKYDEKRILMIPNGIWKSSVTQVRNRGENVFA